MIPMGLEIIRKKTRNKKQKSRQNKQKAKTQQKKEQ